MAREKNNIIRFSRHARRHPRCNLGDAPKERGLGWRKVLDPQFYLRGVIYVSLVLLGVVQFIPDAIGATFASKSASGCRVVSVIDGDTVRMYCPAKGIFKARLQGFDTPEIFNPNCVSERIKGLWATGKLRLFLLQADDIRFVLNGVDRYGRRLVSVFVDGRSLANVMIETEHAVPYGGGKRQNWCAGIA